MSGESTPKPAEIHESLERVFGTRTACSTCADVTLGYRVLALFLHDHAVVRAYCRDCYEDALGGGYSARGEALVLDFDTFAARFGVPGPRPGPSPVDRLLLALMLDPELTGLSPSTECFARRSGPAPWRFTAAFRDGADEVTASFLLGVDGVPLEFDAHPAARARVERALAR